MDKMKKEFNEKDASADELWDYCMEEYQSKNPIVEYLFKIFFKRIYSIIHHLKEDAKMLEVGCGAGESSKRIFSKVKTGQYFEASEYDGRYVKKLKEANTPFMVTEESVYELKRNDNEFNCIFLLEVLEHLEYPEQALKELFRVSNQYVVISVPNEPWWRISNMLRGKYLRDKGNTPGHINHYSVKSLKKIMKKYGKIKKVYTPFPWIIILAEKSIA